MKGNCSQLGGMKRGRGGFGWKFSCRACAEIEGMGIFYLDLSESFDEKETSKFGRHYVAGGLKSLQDGRYGIRRVDI